MVKQGELILDRSKGSGKVAGKPSEDTVERKNGFEVLDEIKSDPELKHLPVIMLTTSNRDSDILQAYAHGAASYLVKPLRFDDLRTMALKLQDYWTAVSRLPQVTTAHSQ